MRKALAAIGCTIALMVTGCAHGGGETVTQTVTVEAKPSTTSQTAASTESYVAHVVTTSIPIYPTTSDIDGSEATGQSVEDAAACRQIARAIESSGLRMYADQIIAGGTPDTMQLSVALLQFSQDLETTPKSASPTVLVPLLGILTATSSASDHLEEVWSDPDSEAAQSMLRTVKVSVRNLDKACGA